MKLFEKALTGAEIDTLISLIENGPLTDSSVPSKVGRDSLISRGFCAQVVIDRNWSNYAATTKGLTWYFETYGADDIDRCRVNRILYTPMP